MDRHLFRLPPDLPPGQYQVQAGMYVSPTLERLPLSTAAGTPLGDMLTLGWLKVTNQESEK